jgi:hypothetical protein
MRLPILSLFLIAAALLAKSRRRRRNRRPAIHGAPNTMRAGSSGQFPAISRAMNSVGRHCPALGGSASTVHITTGRRLMRRCPRAAVGTRNPWCGAGRDDGERPPLSAAMEGRQDPRCLGNGPNHDGAPAVKIAAGVG